MTEKTITDDKLASLDIAALPNLAPRMILVVVLISIVMLLGQFLQDHYRQEEVLEIQRISTYHQQSEVVGRLMNAIFTFEESENAAAVEAAYFSLKTAMSELKSTAKELQSLTDQTQRLDESDNILPEESIVAKDIEQLLISANEFLAFLEAQQYERELKEQNFSEIQALHLNYKTEIPYIISHLSEYLDYESKEHRNISWWLTLTTIILVFLISLAIYRRGKGLVHQQFNAMAEHNMKLKALNELRKKSEIKSAEQAKIAQNQQTKLNSILNATDEAIITTTVDGIIDSFNKAAETMYGFPASFAVGKNIKIIIPKSGHASQDEGIATYKKTGSHEVLGRSREARGVRVDGSEFPIQIYISKVEGVEPELFNYIMQDITAGKKADAKLQNVLTELTNKQLELEEEERIARHVFENITESNNDTIPEVSSWCEPMGTFSGDMMLSAALPSGAIRVILCDFTGHGLPAALGAVPVSTIHSAMAKKELPLEVLMDELNNKLNELLPTGIFSCIAGIDLDVERTQAQIWNAGLPEVLVVSQSGRITQRIVSNHLPLGVVSYDKDELVCQTISLAKGDSIYALSDGLTEAENEAGEMFGQQRFEQLLINETDEQGRLDDIKNKIGQFVGNAAATDDVSLIEIKTLSIVE